jgi:HPt (histidine-containing phosphotransfer) domain-containing protein
VGDFNATALFNEYGDHSLVRELAQLLIETAPGQLDAVRNAIDSGNTQGLRAAAHRLRGSIVAFGVPDAVETARTLEAMGEAGTLTGAEGLITKLAAEVQSLRDSAKAWLETGTALP